MQMGVIAWAPPPHTEWRHKMMPGYFYMLKMKRKRTGETSFLPRHSCDIDPRWLPAFSPVLFWCWSAGGHCVERPGSVFGIGQHAGVSLHVSVTVQSAWCHQMWTTGEHSGSVPNLVNTVVRSVLKPSLYFSFNSDSVFNTKCMTSVFCMSITSPIKLY